MQRLLRFASCAAVVFVVTGADAQQVSLTGAWSVTATVSGNESSQTCAFTHKDSELTGTCKGERGEVTIAGKVDGKNVTWKFQIEYEGQILTPVYTGTIESADKISGGVDVQGMGVTGEFVATRAK
jgi:hypothetical protein